MDEFEFSEGCLRFGRADIPLTPKERAVFAVLARAGGHAVASAALIETVWGESPIGTESLHRCISTLRNKLQPFGAKPVITTVHGFGYRLDVPLRQAPSPVLPEDPEAAEAFRQAMEMFGRRTRPEVTAALRRLTQIRAAHPGFLPAHAFGGHGEISLALLGYDAPEAAAARALALAEGIIRRNVPSADALAVRGFVRAVITASPGGFHDLDDAVSLAPRNWLVRYYRGFARAGNGDFTTAIADFEAAWGASPGAVGIAGTYAYVLHCAGAPERALGLLRQAEDARVLSASANAAHAIIASWLGHHDEAIAAGGRAAVPGISATLSSALAYALARAGRRAEGEACLAGLLADEAMAAAPSMLAPVHLALDDAAAARTALRRAEAVRCPYRHLQRFDPRLGGFLRP